MTKRKVFNAVGCSIYAGLFTVGVKAAGFRVLAHLEQNAYGADTAKLNHPELEMYTGGPTSWPESFKQPVDFIFCNPPCAVWSPVGSAFFGKLAWRDDPRLQHAYDALQLIERYKPTVWAWESVPRALTQGRSMLAEMLAFGKERGYAGTVLHINAMRLGVPQDRPRVFVVMHKVAFEPEPCDYDKVLTVRDVWKKLPKHGREVEATSDSSLKWLPHVAPGQQPRQQFDATFGHDMPLNKHGKVAGRPSLADRRLSFDKPGNPMFAKLWHPDQPRRITLMESLRLCQLPEDWQFGPSTKSVTARKELLQRAVMPGVGRWLAEAVMAALRAGKPAAIDQPAMVYDLRQRDHDVYGFDTGPVPVSSQRNARLPPWEGRLVRPPREPKPRLPPSVDAVAKAKRVCEGTTGSGAEIRRLLVIGKMNDAEIVEHVLKTFDGRKTSKADVAWNRGMLRKAGVLK